VYHFLYGIYLLYMEGVLSAFSYQMFCQQSRQKGTFFVNSTMLKKPKCLFRPEVLIPRETAYGLWCQNKG
jgi:hypothetical protein